MWNRIKDYIKKLVADNSGVPSTRLHLAWGCFFLLGYYVGYNTYIQKDMQSEILWALISGMAAMSGLSVMDKGAKIGPVNTSEVASVFPSTNKGVNVKNGFNPKNN